MFISERDAMGQPKQDVALHPTISTSLNGLYRAESGDDDQVDILLCDSAVTRHSN